jgi:hypothetical protein
MTILCHVSEEKVSILKPINGYVYFSEDCFISMFGRYLYLFDKDLLIKKYGAKKQNSTSACAVLAMTPYASIKEPVNYDRLYFFSDQLGIEWVVSEDIDVIRDSLGILEHWNHMRGVIGRDTITERLWEYKIDLLNKKIIN